MLFSKAADQANELISVSLKTLIDLAKQASSLNLHHAQFRSGKAAIMCLV